MSVHGDGDGIDDILDRDLAAEARPEPAPLYLIDASIYVFRAWHTMPDEFHDTDGWPTNAVQGFARFLLDVLERERGNVEAGEWVEVETFNHLFGG